MGLPVAQSALDRRTHARRDTRIAHVQVEGHVHARRAVPRKLQRFLGHPCHPKLVHVFHRVDMDAGLEHQVALGGIEIAHTDEHGILRFDGRSGGAKTR